MEQGEERVEILRHKLGNLKGHMGGAGGKGHEGHEESGER